MTKFDSKIINFDQQINNKQNYEWWNTNPMTYDWNKKFGKIKYDKKFFKKIDKIFGYGHSLINNPNWPNSRILENFIPYNKIKGKNVLEIGCGAGLLASDLVRSGAKLYAIDITDQAVILTKKRFELNKIKGKIIKMNAEKLSFADKYFDYIISWGVIHHSGNMKKIVDEIHRVLLPKGEAYLMVYNRNSLRYRFYCFFWLGIIKLQLLNKKLSQIAGSITDGFIARHLSEKEAKIIFKKFNSKKITYSDEMNTISMYLLGPFSRILNLLPIKFKLFFERFLAKNYGWYMQIIIKK